MASIEIKGLSSLYKKLDRLKEVEGISPMNKAVGIVTSQAKENANFTQGYQTGELRGSIHNKVLVGKDGLIGLIQTNNDHSIYVEFGTGSRGNGSYPYVSEANVNLTYREDWAGMKAQPYMYPAYKMHEKTIKTLFKDGIKTEIKSKVGGK